MSNPELPVIQKTYDLLKGTSERVARFPLVHRDTLGALVLARLNELFDVQLEAKYTRDRGAMLDRANVLLVQLRFRVRLAFDLRCLRTTGSGFAAEELDAVGRIIGGWRKVAGRFDWPRTAQKLREPPTARCLARRSLKAGIGRPSHPPPARPTRNRLFPLPTRFRSTQLVTIHCVVSISMSRLDKGLHNPGQRDRVPLWRRERERGEVT